MAATANRNMRVQCHRSCRVGHVAPGGLPGGSHSACASIAPRLRRNRADATSVWQMRPPPVSAAPNRASTRSRPAHGRIRRLVRAEASNITRSRRRAATDGDVLPSPCGLVALVQHRLVTATPGGNRTGSNGCFQLGWRTGASARTGTRSATGLPWRMMRTVSPCSTRSSMAEALVRNSPKGNRAFCTNREFCTFLADARPAAGILRRPVL